MKKLIALLLALVCVLGLVGCNNSQQAQENKTANTHTLEVTENSVGEIGRETYNFPVEISEDDANALSQIINGGIWQRTNSQKSGLYHSETGGRSWASWRSCILTGSAEPRGYQSVFIPLRSISTD